MYIDRIKCMPADSLKLYVVCWPIKLTVECSTIPRCSTFWGLILEIKSTEAS